MKSCIFFGLIILCSVVLNGCFDDSAAWLPDSSGMIFIRGDKSVVHYDLNSGKEKVLLQQDWITKEMGTEKPAISPRGDQIVLVRHAVSNQVETVQVLLYDLAGKQLRASAEFPLPGNKKFSPKTLTHLARAQWSSDGRHILITVWADLYENGKRLSDVDQGSKEKPQQTEIYTTAIYDVQDNKLIIVSGAVECELTAMANLSPITPDGSGFLAEPSDNNTGANENINESDEDEFYFVDWTGKKSPFKFSAAAREANKGPPQNAQPGPNAPRGGVTVYGRWDQGILLLAYDKGYLTIDPQRRWIDYREDKEISEWEDYAKQDKAWIRPLKSGVMLQPRRSFEAGKEVNTLEVVQRVRKADKWDVEKKIISDVDDIDGVIESPNGQYWLILCKQNKQSRKLIIDSTGKVLGDLLEATPPAVKGDESVKPPPANTPAAPPPANPEAPAPAAPAIPGRHGPAPTTFIT